MANPFYISVSSKHLHHAWHVIDLKQLFKKIISLPKEREHKGRGLGVKTWIGGWVAIVTTEKPFCGWPEGCADLLLHPCLLHFVNLLFELSPEKQFSLPKMYFVDVRLAIQLVIGISLSFIVIGKVHMDILWQLISVIYSMKSTITWDMGLSSCLWTVIFIRLIKERKLPTVGDAILLARILDCVWRRKQAEHKWPLFSAS